MGAKSSKRKASLVSSGAYSSPGTSVPPPSSPSSPTGLWEWADDSGVFHAYDAAATATIEAAFVAGNTSVALTIGNHTYAMDLAALRQTNNSTAFSRAIRRNPAFASSFSSIPAAAAPLSSSASSVSSSSSLAASSPPATDGGDGSPVWEFEKRKRDEEEEEKEKEEDSDVGEWEAYDKLTTRLLEGSLTNGRANVVLNHGTFAVPGGFMVDFVGMTQTKQSAQETIRVRRIPSIDAAQFPAIAKARTKLAAEGDTAAAAAATTATDVAAASSSGGGDGEKAFSGLGKGQLKEVGKLTKWARVTDKLIPEETCPVCLCEFEQPSEDDDDEGGEGGQHKAKECEDEAPMDGKGKEVDPGQKSGKKKKKKEEEEPTKPKKLPAKQPTPCQGHYFHRDCIVHCYKAGFLQCPICNVVYGLRIGTMPQGTMNVSTYGPSLSGFENCGTVQIDYHFPSGIQGPEHPNPGMSYGGTSRTAYLPDNKEGQEILQLFKIAWERRLLFTVGRSVTTGEDNQVVWGGVHQKTCTSGGATSFGYPDPTYFERVKAELAAKGVTLDS